MQIDTDHVLFWMDAVRNSQDPKRTLESFWKGQVKSKIWLIEKLSNYIDKDNAYSIVIHGGWYGVLASLLFQNSYFDVKTITSIDIDPSCYDIANTINKIEEIQGRFLADTADMCSYFYMSTPDIVINTSCEHITQEQYNEWLSNVPDESLIVLQSNNYDIQEHIRINKSLNEFIDISHVEVLWSGELQLPLYKRFMIIGKKRV
jgi:hypothetical protein